MDSLFSHSDLSQMQTLGISVAQVREQVKLFKESSYFINLEKPCTVGDGIINISLNSIDTYIEMHETAVKNSRFQKFVPASGAGSRMFKIFLEYYYNSSVISCENNVSNAEANINNNFMILMNNIKKIAFYDDLENIIQADDKNVNLLLKSGQYHDILHYILSVRGLNYEYLPKGLIKFHHYATGSRTPFEEHLAEASFYAKDKYGNCHIHFTILPEHEDYFNDLLRK